MAAAVVTMVVGYWWGSRRLDKIRQWPTTEATIEGGSFETMPRHRWEWDPLKAPVLGFSYKVGGEYFTGRIALMKFVDDEGAEIIRRMTGQKLEIYYDPENSTRWFIDDKVDGCRIRQEGTKPEAHRRF